MVESFSNYRIGPSYGHVFSPLIRKGPFLGALSRHCLLSGELNCSQQLPYYLPPLVLTTAEMPPVETFGMIRYVPEGKVTVCGSVLTVAPGVKSVAVALQVPVPVQSMVEQPAQTLAKTISNPRLKFIQIALRSLDHAQ